MHCEGAFTLQLAGGAAFSALRRSGLEVVMGEMAALALFTGGLRCVDIQSLITGRRVRCFGSFYVT